MIFVAINRLRPDFVVLELCDGRIETLCEEIEMTNEEEANITLASVCKDFWKEKSFKTFGIGLLMWMQIKVSNLYLSLSFFFWKFVIRSFIMYFVQTMR